MRFLALCLLLLLVPLARPSAAEPWPALIGVGELRDRLGAPGLRIIDLRGVFAYGRGHAEGAVSVPVARWRAAAAEGTLADLMGEAGIDPRRPLLLLHHDTRASRLAQAARIAWELKESGVPQVSLLQGGMAAWAAAGMPQTEAVPRPRRYRHGYTPGDSAGAAGAAPGGSQEAILVRARLHGPSEPAGPTVSLTDLLRPDHGLPDRAEILDRLKNVPVPWEAAPVLIVGETPEAAAALWFLASEALGIRGVTIAAAEGPGDDMPAGRAAGLGIGHDRGAALDPGTSEPPPVRIASLGAITGLFPMLPAEAPRSPLAHAAPAPASGAAAGTPAAGPVLRQVTEETEKSVLGAPFRIQLGAYRTREEAARLRSRVAAHNADLLEDLDLVVQRSVVRGTVYYRVRGGPFGDRAAAHAACAAFARRSQDCMVWTR